MTRPSYARHIRWLLCIAAFLLVAPLPRAGQAQEDAPARVEKAAYLYKLAPFVQWPDGVFAAPDSPFHICVVGNEAFGRLVAREAAGQRLDRHPFVVRGLDAVGPESGCHIVYANGDERGAQDTLRAVRGRPVLTVTDASSSGAARGIVHFVLHEGRVRFQIDVGMARQQGLAISSRLLELAVQVRK